MYKVKYLKSSQQDLLEIQSYIANDNEHYAVKVIFNIKKTIEFLKIFPEMGTPWKNGFRKLVDTKYKYNIIYKINGKIIEVVSIFKYKNTF